MFQRPALRPAATTLQPPSSDVAPTLVLGAPPPLGSIIDEVGSGDAGATPAFGAIGALVIGGASDGTTVPVAVEVPFGAAVAPPLGAVGDTGLAGDVGSPPTAEAPAALRAAALSFLGFLASLVLRC